MCAEMNDLCCDCFDGADERISRKCQTNNLSTYPIFLLSELEGGKGACRNVGMRGSKDIQPAVSNKEIDIAKSERCAFRGAGSIFSRS